MNLSITRSRCALLALLLAALAGCTGRPCCVQPVAANPVPSPTAAPEPVAQLAPTSTSALAEIPADAAVLPFSTEASAAPGGPRIYGIPQGTLWRATGATAGQECEITIYPEGSPAANLWIACVLLPEGAT